MLLLSIFLVAALLVSLGLRASLPAKRLANGPRPESLVLIGATLFSIAAGWVVFQILSHSTDERSWEQGFLLLLLVAALYFATALCRRAKLPIWLADIFILIAAYLSLQVWHEATVQVLSAPVSTDYIGLGKWATPLTMLWMWVIARMTAAMNRAPQVTGGYLGVVALALLLLLKLKNDAPPHFFAADAGAALAGAGLATVPFAIRRNEFNIGWSAALAMGFLLAQIATIGLLKSATFFMLLLSLVAFGLPLLDVSFFRVRAALRGEQFNVEEQRLRLHEALQRRGVAPVKVTLLYLVIGAWLCGLGALTARFIFSTGAPLWVLLLRAVVLLALFFLGFVLFFSLARVWMRRGESEIIPEEVEAFGVRISPVSMQEALDKIEGFIQESSPHHVVTSDANAILRAQEDEEYAAIMRRAALITPDGFGVVWGARLLNLPIYERVTGVDMVTGICERAARHGYSIYILGSEPGVAATAAEKLTERYPGLRVAGTQHGFWKQDGITDEEIVQRIRDSRPDVLFVAFGIPAQEKFIARHFEALSVPVSLGVGGSFDVYSEKLKRAPEYIQRSGLEWVYRVWQEPWRWKRMSYVPRFMMFALRTWLFGSRHAATPHAKRTDIS
jgi:N-acetylglucosaminyldiphosphoundecaprenol N-acetyl-beta-D-mannosaminyltransferase